MRQPKKLTSFQNLYEDSAVGETYDFEYRFIKPILYTEKKECQEKTSWLPDKEISATSITELKYYWTTSAFTSTLAFQKPFGLLTRKA